MGTFRLELLLVLIMMGFAPAMSRASEDQKNVILYTPYTKIAVPPGESIDYAIDVINKADEVKNAIISMEGIPRGWTTDLKSGGFTISQLAVLPGEKKNFTLKLGVPLKVNKGTYHFKIIAEGEAELPLTVTVSEHGTYKTELATDQPNMQGNSKATFSFTATLKNQTAEQQLYALMANAPRGWNVAFKANYKQATSAQVEPNATENISIDINPPANVAAGTYKIPVRAATSNTSAELELEVVITGSFEMELTTPRGLLSTSITAGETKKIDLLVRNTGSAELKDIKLSANKPLEWEVTFSPAEIPALKAGESTQVSATMKAAKKALPGDYVAKMEAKTPEVNAAADFRVSVRTSMLWGWLGIGIILGAVGIVWYLFRKHGRR